MKKQSPNKQASNPLNTPSHKITVSTKLGNLTTVMPSEWLEKALMEKFSRAKLPFNLDSKKYASAIKAVATTYLDNIDNLSVKKTFEPNSLMKMSAQKALSGKEAGKQINVALTLSNQGEIDGVTIDEKVAKNIKASTPNPLAYSSFSGVSLTGNVGLSESGTSIIASAIGDSIMANIEKLKELERYGIDTAAIEDIRQSLHQSQIDIDSAKLKEKMEKFLTALQTDKAVQSQYLDLHAISGVLQNFASQSGSVANFFSQESIENYCQRKKESALSVENFSTPTPTPQDFFKTICESPKLVAGRLKMPYQGQTIHDFLTTASKEKIADFFATTDEGMQLLANFILIVNTAKDIKSSYKKIPLSISDFSLQVPAKKNSHQPTRQEKALA